MRKLFYLGLLVAAFFLPVVLISATSNVSAVDVLNPVCNNVDPNNVPTVCRDNAANSNDNPIFGPNGIITRGIELLARVVGVAAVIAIIIYGFKFVTSGGDSGEAKTARQGILYALIGLVVAALAQGIVTFILNKL